jgi:anti-sigma regulatory factor (Ser/Thr protein kinase)
MEELRNQLDDVYESEPDAVTAARNGVADYAEAAGATAELVESVKLAVSEAVTNSVVHGYPGAPGEITVSAAIAGEELWVLVADRGRGHHAPSRSPGLGWGLALIAAASDEFVILERSGGGTEVRIRFALPG